jgi:hypothetical protein
MASNKLQQFGPVALTTTLTTNLIAPAAAGAGAVGYTATGVYIVLRHLRVVNKTAVAVTVSLWLGATGANAAGTELVWSASIVPANTAAANWLENYGQWRLEGANGFLVGGASANASLTLEAEGEVGLV